MRRITYTKVVVIEKQDSWVVALFGSAINFSILGCLVSGGSIMNQGNRRGGLFFYILTNPCSFKFISDFLKPIGNMPTNTFIIVWQDLIVLSADGFKLRSYSSLNNCPSTRRLDKSIVISQNLLKEGTAFRQSWRAMLPICLSYDSYIVKLWCTLSRQLRWTFERYYVSFELS